MRGILQVAEAAMHEVLSKVIRFKRLLDVQQLSLPVHQVTKSIALLL